VHAGRLDELEGLQLEAAACSFFSAQACLVQCALSGNAQTPASTTSIVWILLSQSVLTKQCMFISFVAVQLSGNISSHCNAGTRQLKRHGRQLFLNIPSS